MLMDKMWQVRWERGDGLISKVVTRSWLKAALQVARCKLAGCPCKMTLYSGDAVKPKPRGPGTTPS